MILLDTNPTILSSAALSLGLPSSLHKGFGVIHNSEKITGITSNGTAFSNLVQRYTNKGYKFDWKYAGDMVKILTELRHRNSKGKKTKIDFRNLKIKKNIFRRIGDSIIEWIHENPEEFEEMVTDFAENVVDSLIDAVADTISGRKADNSRDSYSYESTYDSDYTDKSGKQDKPDKPNKLEKPDKPDKGMEHSEHSSPRPHDRRGHDRMLGDGRTIKVRPAKVNASEE